MSAIRLDNQGKYEEAARLTEEALAIRRTTLGKRPPRHGGQHQRHRHRRLSAR